MKLKIEKFLGRVKIVVVAMAVVGGTILLYNAPAFACMNSCDCVNGKCQTFDGTSCSDDCAF